MGAQDLGGSMQRAEEQRRQAEAAEARRVADLKARGFNPDGSPIRPEFQSLLNKDTGLLGEQYQAKDMMDTSGIDAYRKRALGTSPSAWADLATQKQGIEEANQRSNLAANAGSAAAMARNQLASKGGLGRGAATSVGRQSMRDLMMGRQGIASQGATNRLNIGLQDEGDRTKMLSALPGMDLQVGQYKTGVGQWNIQKAMEEKRAKDMADMEAYKQGMQAWAAKQQGEAMRNSGGGGGGKK
jgi:hypothetical protein